MESSLELFLTLLEYMTIDAYICPKEFLEELTPSVVFSSGHCVVQNSNISHTNLRLLKNINWLVHLLVNVLSWRHNLFLLSNNWNQSRTKGMLNELGRGGQV